MCCFFYVFFCVSFWFSPNQCTPSPPPPTYTNLQLLTAYSPKLKQILCVLQINKNN